MTTKHNRMFYIGFTSNLQGRVYQHKTKELSGFTSKYNIKKLVYYEEYDNVYEALEREKQLKRWRRQWKINLIKKHNPTFKDLSKEWFEDKKW